MDSIKERRSVGKNWRVGPRTVYYGLKYYRNTKTVKCWLKTSPQSRELGLKELFVQRRTSFKRRGGVSGYDNSWVEVLTDSVGFDVSFTDWTIQCQNVYDRGQLQFIVLWLPDSMIRTGQKVSSSLFNGFFREFCNFIMVLSIFIICRKSIWWIWRFYSTLYDGKSQWKGCFLVQSWRSSKRVDICVYQVILNNSPHVTIRFPYVLSLQQRRPIWWPHLSLTLGSGWYDDTYQRSTFLPLAQDLYKKVIFFKIVLTQNMVQDKIYGYYVLTCFQRHEYLVYKIILCLWFVLFIYQ